MLHKRKGEHMFNMLARVLEDPLLVSVVRDNVHNLQKATLLVKGGWQEGSCASQWGGGVHQ